MNMHGVQLKLDSQAVDEYLEANGLEEGGGVLEVAALQLHGMQSGQPAVLLVGSLDGQKVLLKVSLNMLISVTAGMRGGAEARGWRQPQ